MATAAAIIVFFVVVILLFSPIKATVMRKIDQIAAPVAIPKIIINIERKRNKYNKNQQWPKIGKERQIIFN